MMPLLLLIYTPTFTGEDVKIPYLSIFAGLLIVLVPVSMGMIVLAKKPDAAKKLEKGASGLGAVFIGAALIAGCVQVRTRERRAKREHVGGWLLFVD